MARKRQETLGKGAISGLLQTHSLFLLFGAAGALLGTKVIMLMSGGACVPGIKAGAVFLIISACLAAPAAYLLQRPGGRKGGTASAGGPGGRDNR